MVRSFCEMVIKRKQTANISTYTPEPSRRYNYEDDDDDEEYSIPLNKNALNFSRPVFALATPVSSIWNTRTSLGMTNEELSTIPKKELGEVIKYSIEDLVLIPSETEDTSESDSDCDLPSGDDFSPINISEEKSDVPEENVKIYSNPLFKFDDEYISSNVNPLFDEVLEDIECKESYDCNLDESTFLVTPLSDSNEDEFFALGDDIEFLLHRDPSTPTISIVSILEGFTDELPLEENDDLFDLESKTNDWKKVLYTAQIDDLMTKDKFFDPGGDIDEIDVVKIVLAQLGYVLQITLISTA
ncbi:hypothetical protein Tco_0797076 [Tanacetum coccineum]